jgi:hypothetical protein
MKKTYERAFTAEYLAGMDMNYTMDSKNIWAMMVIMGNPVTDEWKVECDRENELRHAVCVRCPANVLAVWSDVCC